MLQFLLFHNQVIQDQVDADLHYSTNSPAAPPLPAKPTIKKQTDNIVTVPVLSQCHDQVSHLYIIVILLPFALSAEGTSPP